jgi:hypothetical protein
VDFTAFGQTLRQLRKGSGFTQKELAKQLAVSEQLLSIWERAYQHGARSWQPDRASVVRLVSLFARQLTPEEAQIWVVQAGYTLDDAELADLFPQTVLTPLPTPDPHLTRLRLAFLPDQPLFGVDEAQAKLEGLLLEEGRPWLIALEGMGGLGKTSLAHALARTMLESHRFYDLAWISARQEEFLPEGVLRKVIQPALTPQTFVDILLTQLDPALGLTRAGAEKQAILARWLKAKPYLVVVDNLETAEDYQSLLPLLQQLANPTKFLLTSRYSLRRQANVYCHSLRGLGEEDSYALLRHEAEVRDLPLLAQASREFLSRIYQVVGGNPLALKLVAGQLSVLPLSQVLDNLRQANSQTIEELYFYIYWQAWDMLSEAAKQTLVALPLAQEGGFEDVLRESELEAVQVGQALKELVGLSLVNVGGDLEQPRYYLHRLTETFLFNEVIKWQGT